MLPTYADDRPTVHNTNRFRQRTQRADQCISIFRDGTTSKPRPALGCDRGVELRGRSDAGQLAFVYCTNCSDPLHVQSL